MLTREEVLHIAKLAKIELTEAEIEKFQKQLSAVIDYFDILKKVDTSSIPARTHAFDDIQNRFQIEKPGDRTLDRTTALRNSRSKDEKYFITNAVL